MKRLLKNITQKKCLKVFSYLSLFVVFFSCVESFEINNEGFENYLVVSSTITNEFKNQEVFLSKTFPLGEEGPIPVSGAQIIVKTSTGEEYTFIETTNGTYLSNIAFEALADVEYQLEITIGTSIYESLKVISPPKAAIENLVANRIIDDTGKPGVGLFIDSSSDSTMPTFLRYEYEETYKIVAPEWRNSNLDALVIDPETLFGVFTYSERPIEEQVCYNTRFSNEIIVTNTDALSENKISNFLVKFIDSDDISVAERYSVLVKQFSQSREANKFYETLQSFSLSGNLFSQIQTGFVEGNIKPVSNTNEKVIGFFDVSTVSSKRIFFDRNDLLPNDDEFSHFCFTYTPMIRRMESQIDFIDRIANEVKQEGLKFLEEIPDKSPGNGYVTLINRQCGDCTVLGESEIPEFWED